MRRLYFDENLKNPIRIRVCIVVNHAIDDPAFLRCKAEKNILIGCGMTIEKNG